MMIEMRGLVLRAAAVERPEMLAGMIGHHADLAELDHLVSDWEQIERMDVHWVPQSMQDRVVAMGVAVDFDAKAVGGEGRIHH